MKRHLRRPVEALKKTCRDVLEDLQMHLEVEGLHRYPGRLAKKLKPVRDIYVHCTVQGWTRQGIHKDFEVGRYKKYLPEWNLNQTGLKMKEGQPK
jgi:hypothetical protein